MKKDGCNRMTCICGNVQCSICSSDVYRHYYGHFGGVWTGCPWNGPVRARHRLFSAFRKTRLASSCLMRADSMEEEPLITKKEVELCCWVFGSSYKNFMKPLIPPFICSRPSIWKCIPHGTMCQHDKNATSPYSVAASRAGNWLISMELVVLDCRPSRSQEFEICGRLKTDGLKQTA